MAESRRDGLTIEAIDPESGKTCRILISHDRMQSVALRGMGHAKECGFLVPEVLQRPAAVFEGLRRDDDEDRYGYGWRCYSAVPTRSFSPDGRDQAPYRDQVFVVFVNESRVAYNWRWEKADAGDPSLPMNHEVRFRKRLL